LYIVSFVYIFFNLQIYSILQLKNKLKKAKTTNKITINKKETKKAKKIEIETKKTKIKIKITKTNIIVNAKATTTIATTIVNKKYLLKLREQFVYIYISFAFKTTSILLSYCNKLVCLFYIYYFPRIFATRKYSIDVFDIVNLDSVLL